LFKVAYVQTVLFRKYVNETWRKSFFKSSMLTLKAMISRSESITSLYSKHSRNAVIHILALYLCLKHLASLNWTNVKKYILYLHIHIIANPSVYQFSEFVV